jgi:hypothetical protein
MSGVFRHNYAIKNSTIDNRQQTTAATPLMFSTNVFFCISHILFFFFCLSTCDTLNAFQMMVREKLVVLLVVQFL